MRVCILTTSFPLYEGIAVGIHVVEQARHLVKLGVDVDILAPHNQGALDEEIIDGIHVHRFRYMWPEQWQTLCYGAGIPTNLKNSFWAKLQLPFLLLVLFLHTIKIGRKSDIIHAHWSLTGLVGVLAGKLLGKPVVLMMHGAEVYVLKGNVLIKYILEQADHVLCNSNFTLSKILEISQPVAYSVVAPGVDIRRFSPEVSTSLFYEREPDIPQNCPLVFALGKYIERKGFSYLIDAIALLGQAPLPFLMIGGRGPLKEQLQQQAQRLGIVDRIKFLEYIPDDCIPAYYKAADVFVLPSIVDERNDTEGLGVVLLESLACETPCIASNVGGILDVIVDQVNGFLVEPKNPQMLAERIKELIINDNLRQEMGVNGRQFVEKNFSWRAKAQEILDIYECLLKKKVELS